MAALGADLQAKIEAYLLGRLPNGEQTRIEALLFEDDAVLQAVRDAEDDLIDRYLAGELAPADREAFEQKFATSASRQERIAFARALPQGLASSSGAPAHPTPAAVVEFARGRHAGFSTARRFALPAGATVAAALVLGIAWRAGLTTRDDQAVSPPPGTGTTSRPSRATGLASPAPGETLPPPSKGPTVATLNLPRSELRRGAGSLPRLRVPDGTTAIRLQPEVDAPITGARYVVTLRRVEGPVVWQGTAQADVARGRLSVTVPVRLVGPGDYVLRLSAPGTSPDDSAEYPFRISPRG
jgi:hypothetical protein